jgi:hypothetical protein
VLHAAKRQGIHAHTTRAVELLTTCVITNSLQLKQPGSKMAYRVTANNASILLGTAINGHSGTRTGFDDSCVSGKGLPPVLGDVGTSWTPNHQLVWAHSNVPFTQTSQGMVMKPHLNDQGLGLNFRGKEDASDCSPLAIQK